MLSRFDVAVYASALAVESLATPNLDGVIVGAALHTGRFTMEAALEAIRGRGRAR